MRGKERAELRAAAHHLDPIVHVGVGGLTDAVIASLDDALRTHELVKVQLGKHLEVSAKEAATALATATASEVIQVIGRTCTLYRPKPLTTE
ncbi:MAG TPA: ribosome assembly RNA-binding protein YhbY [Gemmatimonadaceae bacterium]|nr:ribosome assembly RNA-binding protein YhbY [Gemmatimonadaceae bacterium]